MNEDYENVKNYLLRSIHSISIFNCKTLDFNDKKFKTLVINLAKYNDNVILITMQGHIVCSKYGIIYDSFDCRDRKAEFCWIIK